MESDYWHLIERICGETSVEFKEQIKNNDFNNTLQIAKWIAPGVLYVILNVHPEGKK